jgi:hypothetical protein
LPVKDFKRFFEKIEKTEENRKDMIRRAWIFRAQFKRKFFITWDLRKRQFSYKKANTD